eukprot:jgi/Astpho2/1747/Aster-x0492
MRAAYSGPLQVLLALANSRNRVPLPEPLKDCHGLRLPRDEDCLLASNYQFHPVNPPAEAMDVDDAQEYDEYFTAAAAPPAGKPARGNAVQPQHMAFSEDPIPAPPASTSAPASKSIHITPVVPRPGLPG